MSINLDENYSAATKLSDWWKQVKSNFQRLNSGKADKTQYASIDQAGLIKLYSGTSGGVRVNKSGLVVSETDGTAYVAIKSGGGLMRDGAGALYTFTKSDGGITVGSDGLYAATKSDGGITVDSDGLYVVTKSDGGITVGSDGLYVTGATEEEVKAGTDAYKPVTSSVFRSGVENITGKVSELPSMVSKKKAGAMLELKPNDFSSAISFIASYMKSDGGTLGVIDNDDFKLTNLAGQKTASMNMNSELALEHGVYLFMPKDYVISESVSYPIGSINITNRAGETAKLSGDFEEGSVYLIQLEKDNSAVLATLTDTESYSTTPKRVGAWIDGTPVWRITLPYIQMQTDRRHLIVDEINHNISVNIPDILSDYLDDEDVPLLNVNINVYSEYPTYLNPPDDVILGKIYFAKQNEKFYEDYITDENGYWGGYIEFISSKDNIKD